MSLPTVELICAECGVSFQKVRAEYRRRKKRGGVLFFCTGTCSLRQWHRGRPSDSSAADHLDAGNRRDELTHFRWFMARVRYREVKKGKSDLTLKYLKYLWGRQKGICPFTGWELILPLSTVGWVEKSIQNASLDRIDCSKGYVKRNVRFVSVMANMARGTFEDVDLKEFCAAVARHSG